MRSAQLLAAAAAVAAAACGAPRPTDQACMERVDACLARCDIEGAPGGEAAWQNMPSADDRAPCVRRCHELCRSR